MNEKLKKKVVKVFIMTIYISLLRGVNVGGHKIKMQELKDLFESLNLKKVKTYIQSGNVIFESSKPLQNIKEKIEGEIIKSFGFEVPIFIWNLTEFDNIIKNNPYYDEDLDELYVTFLSNKPVNVPVNEINKKADKSEKFQITEKEIYLILPNGYGRTKLNTNYFEKKLKLFATTRNWKTINKLYALANDVQ